MKKFLISFLLLMPLTVFSQVARLPYATIRQEYKGDTCTQFFSGDSSNWHTSKSVFSFDKPVFVQGTNIGTSSGSNSGFLYYNPDSSAFWPYDDQASSKLGGLYWDAGSLNVDTTFYAHSVWDAGIGGYSENWYGVYGYSANSNAIVGYSIAGRGAVFSSVNKDGLLASTTSGYNNVKIGTGSDTIAFRKDGTFHQYISGSEELFTTTSGDIKSNGTYQYTMGSSSTYVVTPGVLKNYYTDAANSGTSETDLYTFTLPANALINNGDKLEILYSVYVTDNVASNIIALYFGNSSLSQLYADALSTTNETVNYKFLLIRTSSSTLRYNLNIESGDYHSYANYDLSSLDFTTTQVIKVTGTGTASDVIVAKMGTITYIPAAVN